MYEARLAALVMAIRDGEHRYTAHATDMLQDRGVQAVDFEQAMMVGDLEIIEDYREYEPGDPPRGRARSSGGSFRAGYSTPSSPTHPRRW